MPEVFRLLGLRFFFFSNEHEPMHIHVEGKGGHARFMIRPVVLIENKGLKPRDLRLAQTLVEENEGLIETKWNQYFGTLDQDEE